MSGQAIGTVVGGVIGAFFGPVGAQVGMAIGGMIGGAIDPTVIKGPHIGDGQTQSATDGTPIVWVMGTMWTAGCIVDVGKRREVKKKSGGKGGGPVQETYEAHQDFVILVCESDAIKGSTINSIIAIEQDGKIVYDSRIGSPLGAPSKVQPGANIGFLPPPNGLTASANVKYIRNVTFYYGSEAQLPPALVETIHGAGNNPAYRAVALACFRDFNLTPAGDRIPSFRFLVSSHSGSLLSSLNFISGTWIDNAGRDWTLVTQTLLDRWREQPVIMPVFTDGNMLLLPDTNNHDGTFDYYAGGNVGLRTSIAQSLGLTDFTITVRVRMNLHVESENTSSSFLAIYFSSIGRLTLGCRLGMTKAVENTVTPGGWQKTTITSLALGPGGEATFVVSRVGDVVSTYCNGTKYAEYTGTQSSGMTSIVLGNGDGSTATTLGWAGSVESFVMTGTVATQSADLASVVSNIVNRGGIPNTQIDTGQLGGNAVLGYAVAKQMSAQAALGPLLGAYFAYASEYDGKLNFLFAGADAVLTIDDADVVDDGNGPPVQSVRNNATEYPRSVTGQYYDPDQNYMPATVRASRRADGVTATGDTTLQLPVVMPAVQAQQAVDKALKLAYAALDGTIDVTVPFATASNCYLRLVPGDAVIFRGQRFVITKGTIGAGTLKLSLQADRQSAYTSNVQAVPGRTPTPPASRYSGPTSVLPMNLPQLRSQDPLGVYISVFSNPFDANWSSAAVQMSIDSGATWQTVETATVDANVGWIVASIDMPLSTPVANWIADTGTVADNASPAGITATAAATAHQDLAIPAEYVGGTVTLAYTAGQVADTSGTVAMDVEYLDASDASLGSTTTAQASSDAQAAVLAVPANAVTVRAKINVAVGGGVASDIAMTFASSGSSALIVQMRDDLSNVTTAQLDANQNALAVVGASSNEVLQFATATESTATSNLYVLTDMRRGLLGTMPLEPAANDAVAVLSDTQIVPLDTSFAGKTIQFRAVGDGETPDDAVVSSIVYQPMPTVIIIDGGSPGDGLPPPGG